jgi:hypothetical protein
MSHGSSPLGPSSTPASSSFAQHITTNASASSSSSPYHLAPGGPSSRPAKRVKVEHINSQDGRIGASSVSGSGSGSMGRMGERARSYSMREEEEEEREPEYVGDPANLEVGQIILVLPSILNLKSPDSCPGNKQHFDLVSIFWQLIAISQRSHLPLPPLLKAPYLPNTKTGQGTGESIERPTERGDRRRKSMGRCHEASGGCCGRKQ